MPMEVDTIIGEERNTDNRGHVSHSTERLDDLFFTDPDHEEVRSSEEAEVQNYWEAGLTTESLSALKMGKVEHSRHKIIHQEQKTIQQVPELQ